MTKANVDTSNWTPVERAYSLWLRTAREKAGSAVALVREIAAYLSRAGSLEYVPPQWASHFTEENDIRWARRTISQWESGQSPKRQPRQPSDEWLREALIEVISKRVPNPPGAMNWSTFREVSDAFYTERRERQERGGKETEVRAIRERDDERHHFLATRPSSAKLLDPVELGLGSWAFDNALPPYVARTIDQKLVARLKNPGVTTVSGAPKSGKSRSILEMLQQEHPDALTWWVNPSPTVLPLVVQAAKKVPKAGEKPMFVVLDDAGLIGTDPQHGLTAQRISELGAACTHLIVVIHEETLAGWEHQLVHRAPSKFGGQGIGATHELMELLKHRIRYASVLDDTETPAAAASYEQADSRVQDFELTRIAETFAGVQTLLRKAHKALETPTGMEAALLEAAIDASIAFPSGSTPETLSILAKTHYRKRQPNRPWRPHLLDAAFDALATGITIGSPHAVLTTTDHETYRLMDALVPELQHPDRDVLEILENSELDEITFISSMIYTGQWFYLTHRLDQARQAWKYAARAGNIACINNLGNLELRDGEPEKSRFWYLQAAEAGSSESMHGLGVIEDQAGNRKEARTWWLRAAEAGSTEAMHNLGVLADESGDQKEARTWWVRAAEAGANEAMNKLGILAKQTGDIRKARTWWKQAAEAGNTNGMHNLGGLEYQAGNLRKARTWWRQAAEAGNTDSMYNLGVIASEAGNTDEAKIWWGKAAKAGHANAMYNLGHLANESGNTDKAKTWWLQSAEAGDIDAMEELAKLAEKDNDHAEATLWWVRVAVAKQSEPIKYLWTQF